MKKIFLYKYLQVLAITILIVLTLCMGGGRADTLIPEISVDFSKPESVKSLSGFLGTLKETHVKDEFLLPLKPKYWRGPSDVEAATRMEALGGKLIIPCTNYWGAPGFPFSKNGQKTPPFKDFPAYEEAIRAMTAQHRTRVIYDVWNEPDIPIFWGFWQGADFGKFLETFKRTHDIIRQELGEEAVISGPSIFFFSERKLKRFCDYCKDNNLKVQILSFHLLYQPDDTLPEIETRLRTVKSLYINNPDYASVGFRELHINEYLMAYKQDVRPGSVMAFLRHMEKGGVDGAAKACWAHPTDCSNIIECYIGDWKTCGDGSINGLLTPLFEPRAIWWAYKHYADGVDSRVYADSSEKTLMPLASSRSEDPDQAQIMVAYYGNNLKNPLSDISVELNNLTALPFIGPDTQRARITVKRIPFSGVGADPVPRLPVLMDSVPVKIQDSKAVVIIRDMQPYDVFVIWVSQDR